MYKNLIFISLLFIYLNNYSQIAIGDWRIHSTYNNGLKVIDAGNRVYCITNNGMFFFNTTDNSCENLSKVDGLSDVNITTANYFENTLIIGYDNGNIDIIIGKTIYNIPYIKQKQLYGLKKINDIYFYNSYAYLSCGFGIVKIDYKKAEITDTYFIGENSSQIAVNDLAVLNNYFYAASEDGIYKADVNNSNLAFYENWDKIIDIPSNTEYSLIETFNNSIYAVEKSSLNILHKLNNDIWSVIEPFEATLYYSIKAQNNSLLICNDNKLNILDNNDNLTQSISEYNYNWGTQNTSIRDAIIKNNVYYSADYYSSLVKITNSLAQQIKPNGPSINTFYRMDIFEGKLWGVQGGFTNIWDPQHKAPYMMNFENNYWINKKATGSYLTDLTDVQIDRENSSKAYFASYSGGVVQVINGVQDTVFTNFDNPWPGAVTNYVASVSQDSKNQVWISLTAVTNQFYVKTSDNKWHPLNYSEKTGVGKIGNMIITKDDVKWAILPRVGLFAFDDKGTFENTNDDSFKKFSVLDETGNVVSSEPICIAEDKDGAIWVGTTKGVVTYFYPKEVFNEGTYTGQRVIIEQNGIPQYLLETEEITAIAIDGNNSKWIGTKYSGVYQISADGTKELKHFSTENSPILSNEIVSISINDISGEIFIGTEKGLISYKGTATEGNEFYTNVYAYPNPVPHDYNGVIAINGLVTNANVKITDISGNIVFETKAEGGQAIWNGKNFDGERVKTGVYLAFCSNEEGDKTFVTKILFIN